MADRQLAGREPVGADLALLGGERTQEGPTMPSDIRIIHAHEFLRATEDGRLDLEQSKMAPVRSHQPHPHQNTMMCSSIPAAHIQR